MITEAVEIGIAVIKKGRKKAGIQGHAVEVLHRRKKESMDTIDTTTRIKRDTDHVLETAEEIIDEAALPLLACMTQCLNIEMDVTGIVTGSVATIEKAENTEDEYRLWQ